MKRIGNRLALEWVWRVAGKAKWWPVLQAVVCIFRSGIAIAYAYFLGSMVDAAASGGRKAFARDFQWFAVCNFLSIFLLFVSRYLSARSKNAMDRAFRLRVFSQLMHRDFGRISQTHTGEWMNRITSDTELITTAASQILPETVGALTNIVSALLVLAQIVPQLTFILLPGGLLMACVSLLLQERLKRFHKTVQHTDGKFRAFMQEQLYSLLVIHSFTQESASEAIAGQWMDQLNTVRLQRVHFSNLCNAALGGAMVTAQILGLGLCGLGILKGTVSYGMMSTVLYLVNRLESPLKNISGYISQYYGMLAGAERLMEIETYEWDSPGAVVPQEEILRYYAQEFDSFGLEHVDFAYDTDEGKEVLQDFSLTVRKGEFVAFTGGSGCGKSTTLKVLLCLYPLRSGQIYRQDINGTRQMLDSGWRGLFAYVPQGNQLISGTIRETITFSNPALMGQDEKLFRVLEIACADTFVRELPNGLDTVLGERGSGLSEGQMQRLSIARALLSGQPVLLLDECTSALDAATEEQLLKNLRGMIDRTVLIITHRKAALSFCDKQIHFEKPLPK